MRRSSAPAEAAESEAAESEVDYRFTLAAERTFLAWVRTALALLAGGAALIELGRGGTGMHSMPVPLPTCCIALATVVVVVGYLRLRGVNRAMKHGQPLPGTATAALTAVTIAALCVLVVVTTG